MTFEELQQGKSELRQKITHLFGFLKIEELEEKKAEIEKTMSAPDFWNDKESAQSTVAEMSSVRNIIEPFRQLEKSIDDYDAALELAAEDEDFVSECEIDYRRLKKSMYKLEIMSFLSGKSMDAADQSEILFDGQVGRNRSLLRGYADETLYPLRFPRDAETAHQGIPLRGFCQTGEHFDGGGFTGTVDA